MAWYRSHNYALDELWNGAGPLGPTPDRRAVVYAAVRMQLEADNKRPWNLSQKLNEAPYRYNRDTLWAALNSISGRLVASQDPVHFGIEDDFEHPTIKTYSAFVNAHLPKTLSTLINGIMDASRWA